MAQPQATPAPVPAAVPYAPAPVVAPTETTAETAKPQRPKASRWYAKPQVVGVGGLLALILVLLGYRFLGPWITALVVLAVAVAGFLVALAWHRKSQRAARKPGGTANRPGVRRGVRARLADWRAGTSATRSAGAPGGRPRGRLAALRSKFSRGAGGRSGGGGTGGAPSTRGRFRNPFGRVSRAARGSGGSSRRGSGGRFGLGGFGRRSGSGGSRRSGGSSTGRSGGSSGSKRSTSSTAKRVKAAGGFFRNARNALGLTKPTAKRTDAKPTATAPKSTAKPAPPAAPGRPPGSKPSPRPRDAVSPPPTAPPAPSAPKHPANPSTRSTGGTAVTEPMQFADDQSLQRMGANLAGASTAADEVARLFAEAEAARDRYQQVFGKIAAQAESELPTSPRLLAEIQGVHSRAGQASSADAWRAVATEAEQLPAVYRREHETDQDRLDTPRGGHAQEKRADVSAATQDN